MNSWTSMLALQMKFLLVIIMTKGTKLHSWPKQGILLCKIEITNLVLIQATYKRWSYFS